MISLPPSSILKFCKYISGAIISIRFLFLKNLPPNLPADRQTRRLARQLAERNAPCRSKLCFTAGVRTNSRILHQSLTVLIIFIILLVCILFIENF